MNQVIEVKKYGKDYHFNTVRDGTFGLLWVAHALLCVINFLLQRAMTMSSQLRYRLISILIGHAKCFFPQWCDIGPYTVPVDSYIV